MMAHACCAMMAAGIAITTAWHTLFHNHSHLHPADFWCVPAGLAGAVLARVCLNATAPTQPADGFSYVFRGFYNIRITSVGFGTADMFIDPRGRTPGESAAPLISANISDSFSQLNANTFNFTVRYSVGRGYTFILTDAEFSTPPGTGVQFDLGTNTLQWTIDSGAGGALNNISSVAYYNAILLRAFSNNTVAPGSSTRVSNLKFTAEGATSCGSLTDMFASSGGTQLVTQWLVSDSDLAATSWTVTGQVELNRATGIGNIASWTQFDIYTVALVDQAFEECRGSTCPVRLSGQYYCS